MYPNLSAPFKLKTRLCLLALSTLSLTACPNRQEDEAAPNYKAQLQAKISNENQFAQHDLNKDGALNLEEVQAVLEGIDAAAFSTLDLDGSQKLSAAELGVPMPSRKLHLASPEWQDQILYFIMTDRFNDGDPSNNRQATQDYDPADDRKFSGGDLLGIQQKIDYIKGLGATGVWITPPVSNQWWDPLVNYGGYHGYWAQNFTEVDPHFGTLADYRNLSSALHNQGMYLIQDIVVNHTGNFFSYRDGYDAADPAKFVQMNPQSEPVSVPTQSPFDQNDPRNTADRSAAIYHWTPTINNFQDDAQEKNYQLADLDDLNTENPVVQRALRHSYNYWIREVGVDGFRIDTVFYVKPEFFTDFLKSTDAQAPGIDTTAQLTGRQNFLSFGEGFASDKAFEDTKAKKIDSYMTDPANGKDILPSMINFPLYTTAGDVFARGRPTAELAYRIQNMMSLHKRPELMPSFLDNHDVDRFLAGGSEAALKQNLLLMMTLPGIPVIYYGTEQGFKLQRAAMFQQGVNSDGKDHFDTQSPLYKYLQKITALRKDNRIFSRGTPKLLKSNPARSGVLAYSMSVEGAQAIVVFNTSDSESLLDNMPTGLTPLTLLTPLAAIDGTAPVQQVDAKGRLSLKLPARSGYVWAVSNQQGTAPGSQMSIPLPALAPVQTDDFELSGKVSGIIAPFKLVIDGDLAHAQLVTPAVDGSWSAQISTAAMADPNIEHSLVAWHEASNSLSDTLSFKVEPVIKLLADLSDPAQDDTGPTGQYQYPTDPSWGANRQLDIRNVKVSSIGSSLQVDIQINKLTSVWNPANGFDHVAFTLFVQIPGQTGGQSLMPLQNASLPDGMLWHYRLRAHGWSNAWFSATGSAADNEGTSVSPAAAISVNPETQTISFRLSAESLGKPASLSGIKLYLNTWDYDGGYRGLTPEPEQWQFSGGKATDPRIMDDIPVIQLD